MNTKRQKVLNSRKMTRSIPIIAFVMVLFLVLPCWGEEKEDYPELSVKDNNASLTINDQIFKIFKIDDSFIYDGTESFNIPGFRAKMYDFIKSNTEEISIIVFKSKGKFGKVNLRTDVLDNGYFESGGKRYYYYTTKETMGLLCTIIKAIQVPIQDEAKVLVQYIEVLNATGIHCDKWSDPWNLSNEQKEYIDKFNARSNQYIKILSME
jgi:hypothetical protein